MAILFAGCASLERAPGTTTPVATHSLPATAVATCPAAPAAPACPVCPACPAVKPEPPATKVPILAPVSFSELAGWQTDDLAAAWSAFRSSCHALRFQPAWKGACGEAAKLNSTPGSVAVRRFFETHFLPYRAASPDGNVTGLATGYYEPLLKGSRTRKSPYIHPLYAPPDDLLVVDLAGINPELRNMRLRGRLEGRRVVPYWTRGEISQGAGGASGREVVWVDEPVEAFFLEVQGSGRIQLDSGETIRLSYADQNGHPYQSIGRWLIDQGELKASEASMQGIKAWARANPSRLRELLDRNPSYVFFQEKPVGDPQAGPAGAQGIPLTPGRSIAVDPRFIPLGAPVMLSTTMPNSEVPLERLVVAQDTGGAIRGAVRADFFWGFGSEAGELAGRMRQSLKMWVLLPKGYPLPAN